MGFVRKRLSRTLGTRYQAVAVLGGARVQLGTFDTFTLATDAWQHAETAARRGLPGGDPRAARRPFADVAEEYLATQQLAASTRKSCTSPVRTHLIPRFGAVRVADITPARIGAWMSEAQAAGRPRREHRAPAAQRRTCRPPDDVHRVVRDGGDLAGRVPPAQAGVDGQWPQLRREFNDHGPGTQLLLIAVVVGQAALVRVPGC